MALDGHTLYKILYNMKLGLADLWAFGVLCAIVKVSETWIDAIPGLLGNKALVGYLCNARMVLVLVSSGGAKLAHCGQSLRVLNTSAIQCHFKSYCTHLEAYWIPYKRVHGSVGGEVQILRKAARELWVGPQTRAISVRCTCIDGLVL